MGNFKIFKRELDLIRSSAHPMSVTFKVKENYFFALLEKGRKDFLLKLKGEILREIRDDGSKLQRR